MEGSRLNGLCMAAIVSPKTSPVPPAEGEGRRASAQERSALMANAIRALAMDAVQQANSGHPGAPMGMADMAVALWGGTCATTRPIRTGPIATASCSRTATRSMLLYSLLHLTGYDLALSRAAATSASCTARRPATPSTA